METRTGGCHCKKVRYEVNIDLTQPVIECNCSHCQAKGLLLAFVPREQMTLASGEDSLTEYRFNTHKIEHLFCSVCGVQPFGFGEQGEKKMTAINIRSLDDIDLSFVQRVPYDGKNK